MAFGIGGALIGAGLGGLAGLLAPDGKANFTNPQFVNEFTGPLGTATRGGFTFQQDPSRQAAVDFANQQLQGQLASVLAGADPGRIARFQEAFLNARRPQLEESLQRQRQRTNANIAGQGLSGSSSSLFQKGREDELANRQRTQLFNESILGGEALANQALQQGLAQLGATQGLSQQDIGNRLAAMNTTSGALRGTNQLELQKSRLLNELAMKRAAQSGNRFRNIIGGITAGAGFGSLFGGGGSGGGGLSGSAASAPDSFTRAFGNF